MTKTAIEWSDEVWNPVTGCDKVSAGCDNCYAERVAHRFGRPFLGAVELHPKRLGEPLRWRKPRKVFVNSVSDLFHPDVDDLFLAEVFAVMSLTPQHTYQILTKRHKAMQGVLTSDDWWYKVWLARRRLLNRNIAADRREREYQPVRPLPNVWLGVSVENQRYADMRIPHLLATPAAVRFLSVEPMLGPVNFSLEWTPGAVNGRRQREGAALGPIDWVIVGGESGAGARPMHPDWARTIRDECTAAGIPFFFKQWGEWSPDRPPGLGRRTMQSFQPDGTLYDGHTNESWQACTSVYRIGKKAAGSELDGRTWDEYPA